MSNIEELHSRITAAMDRISTGVEVLSAKSDASDEIEGLNDALEEERLANAQLKERIKTLNEKHVEEMEAMQAKLVDNGEVERLRAELDGQANAMTRLDADIQRLRQANEQLRASNAALREANEAGVGEPHLINKAMLAELEGLRASREADAAEVSAILSRLEPMLDAAGQTTGGES